MPPVTPLSPELAVAAASALVDDARLAALLDRLAADRTLDWDRVLPMAAYHGVEHLLNDRVGKLRPGSMPVTVRQTLHSRLIHASALHASQTLTACKVLRALEQGGVPAMVIKGAGVGHLLYPPHPEFRASYDVDVLVAPEDLPRAERLLGELGLVRTAPLAVPERLQPMLLKLANVVDFREPRLATTVEVHIRPTPNPHAFPVPVAALFEASTMVDTPSGPLRTLDGPINVAYLCHHALNSVVFRLKWFADTARAERRAGMPCDRYVAGSEAGLPQNPARIVGRLLRWFESSIDALAAASVGPAPDAGTGYIVQSMEARRHVPLQRSLARLPTEFANLRFTLRLQPGLRAKAYEWLLFASDPRDVTTLRLGTRFTALYAVAGPLLSVGRFAGAIGRAPVD